LPVSHIIFNMRTFLTNNTTIIFKNAMRKHMLKKINKNIKTTTNYNTFKYIGHCVKGLPNNMS